MGFTDRLELETGVKVFFVHLNQSTKVRSDKLPPLLANKAMGDCDGAWESRPGAGKSRDPGGRSHQKG